MLLFVRLLLWILEIALLLLLLLLLLLAVACVLVEDLARRTRPVQLQCAVTTVTSRNCYRLKLH